MFDDDQKLWVCPCITLDNDEIVRRMVVKTKNGDRCNRGVDATRDVRHEWCLPQKLPIEHKGRTEIIEQ